MPSGSWRHMKYSKTNENITRRFKKHSSSWKPGPKSKRSVAHSPRASTPTMTLIPNINANVTTGNKSTSPSAQFNHTRFSEVEVTE